MKLIQSIVYSNVFIAYCGVCLKLFWYPETSAWHLAFLFFAILFVYSALKWIGRNKQNNYEITSPAFWLLQNTKLQLLTLFIASWGFLVSWYQLHFYISKSWYIALVLLFVYLLFRLTPQIRIRFRLLQAFLKIAMVAFVWTFSIAEYSSTVSFIAVVFTQFFFILGLMIPFEINDMNNDAPFGVPTLPLCIGMHKSKAMAVLFFCLSFFSTLFTGIESVHFSAFTFVLVLSSVFLFLSSSHRSNLFYYICIDGLLCLPYTIVCFYLFLRNIF